MFARLATQIMITAIIYTTFSYQQQTNPITSDEICVPDCASQIFCYGELLHDVQMARIYPDSKTFVDKQLMYSETEILNKYAQLKNKTGGKPPSVEQLRRFIDDNFKDDPLEDWRPPDFKTEPAIAKQIADENYRQWILQINTIWTELSKKVGRHVSENPDRHSSIYLPNGFVVAGGRFAEMYYWDTYWIIRGLLLCEMYQTVKGIIENFIRLVDIYGHVPNGSRRYYTQRSQPPLLIQMVATYHSCTQDHDFIRNNIKYLDAEFEYWYSNRMVPVYKDGAIYRLARYNVVSCYPRPESYYEDYTLASNLTTEAEKRKLYSNIKSAAETGWDFSSRDTIGPDGSNNGSLISLNTPNILYVDLNSILHANAVVLSEWYRLLGNKPRSSYYKRVANKLLTAIDAVFWNEDVGSWLDWDLINNRSRNYFYPSNLTPLWTGSYYKKKNPIEKILLYLSSQGIIKLDGSPSYWGVPTSLINTTEQWDYPNCWPPLQAIVIQGLERSNHPVAKYIAFGLAQNWVRTMYTGFVTYGVMFEKYNAIEEGESGSGGEYTAQKGFGWTNGICLEMFNTWGMYLNSKFVPTIKPVPVQQNGG